jgi:hypothetical protein
MTLAICWKCGAQKIGALTLCAHCGAIPASSDDKAISILLSDHYRTASDLDTLGKSIAVGEAPRFDAAEVARVLSVVQDEPSLARGCTIAVWIPVVLLGLLAIAVGTLYFLGAYR